MLSEVCYVGTGTVGALEVKGKASSKLRVATVLAGKVARVCGG
jgi:hypothetical protein